MTSLSNEGFFSKGVTSAAFIFVGTIPVDMDKLTMFVMLGRRQSKCSFRNQVGTGSSAHDFEGLLLISRLTSSSVAGKKMLSLYTHHDCAWRKKAYKCMSKIQIVSFSLVLMEECLPFSSSLGGRALE